MSSRFWCLTGGMAALFVVVFLFCLRDGSRRWGTVDRAGGKAVVVVSGLFGGVEQPFLPSYCTKPNND